MMDLEERNSSHADHEPVRKSFFAKINTMDAFIFTDAFIFPFILSCLLLIAYSFSIHLKRSAATMMRMEIRFFTEQNPCRLYVARSNEQADPEEYSANVKLIHGEGDNATTCRFFQTHEHADSYCRQGYLITEHTIYDVKACAEKAQVFAVPQSELELLDMPQDMADRELTFSQQDLWFGRIVPVFSNKILQGLLLYGSTDEITVNQWHWVAAPFPGITEIVGVRTFWFGQLELVFDIAGEVKFARLDLETLQFVQ